MTATMVRHPAKWTPAVLSRAATLMFSLSRKADLRVLDPFAGIGTIHRWYPIFDTVGIELEPEWAEGHPRTIIGDARNLPFPDASFDAIVTSPCYGNRMADHHDAKDASKRTTYKHTLGRDLTPGNAGMLQWGPAYRMLHELAWWEAHRVLVSQGLAVINVSNHIRAGVEQHVVEWHLKTWIELGARLEWMERVNTPRNRNGANADLRVDGEMIFVVRKP